MPDIIKARARYIGSTIEGGYWSNSGSVSFYTVKIKQDGWKVIIIDSEDESKISRTEYDSLADFLDKWNIYCVINIIRK